jgi:peptidoglycan/LPS O-acetylase OafA/YrhL
MHTPLTELLLRSWLSVELPRRDERGDVPGWVMVTVMTIGLAIAIFTFAEEPLKGLLSAAFNQVK